MDLPVLPALGQSSFLEALASHVNKTVTSVKIQQPAANAVQDSLCSQAPVLFVRNNVPHVLQIKTVRAAKRATTLNWMKEV